MQAVGGEPGGEAEQNPPDEARPFVDEARVDLHQGRAGADFFVRVLRCEDSADSDDGQPPSAADERPTDDSGGQLFDGHTGQTASLRRERVFELPGEGGVGGDQPVHALSERDVDELIHGL